MLIFVNLDYSDLGSSKLLWLNVLVSLICWLFISFEMDEETIRSVKDEEG